MCHFDILTVCHAVTEPRYLYKNKHGRLQLYHTTCIYAICLVLGPRKKPATALANLNVCHLLITQTNRQLDGPSNRATDTFAAHRFVMHGFMFMHSFGRAKRWPDPDAFLIPFSHSFSPLYYYFCPPLCLYIQLTATRNCCANGLKRHLSSGLSTERSALTASVSRHFVAAIDRALTMKRTGMRMRMCMWMQTAASLGCIFN